MTIASLIVDIAANTVSLDQSVKKVQSSLDGIGEAATKMAGTLGIAFSAGAIISFAKSTFDAASQIHDMAEQAGISTDALQGFKEAAELSGAHLEDVTGAIQKMNKNLAGGDKATVQALKDAGLSFQTIRGMKPEDAFLAIADAVQQIPDPMVQSRVALELFGKGAGSLLPGIKEGFRSAADAADKMSKDTIDTLEAAQDAWDKLGKKVTIVTGTMLAATISTTSQITGSVQGFALFVDNAIKYGVGGAVAMADAQEKAAKAAAKNRDINLALPEPIHKTAAELEAAAKAAEEHAKAIQTLTDKLSGNGAIKAANDMVEALRKAPPIQKLTADAQDDVNKTMKAAIDGYTTLGRTAPKAILDTYTQTLELAHVHELLAIAIAHAKAEAKEEADTFERFNKSAGIYLANLPTAIFQTTSFAGSVQQVSAAAATYQGNLAYAAKGTLDWENAVVILSDSLSLLLGRLGGAGSLVTSFAQAIVVGEKSTKQFGNSAGVAAALFDKNATETQKWAAATQSGAAIVGGAMDVWSATTDTATKSANTLHGAVAGAKAGAAFGPYGVAIGAAAGAIVGFVRSLSAGRNAVVDFAKSFGGFDELHAKLNTLGAEGEQLWIKLTQGTAKGDPTAAAKVIDQINKELADQNGWMSRLPDLIDKYGLSWADAGDKAKQAHLDDIAKGLIQDFADLSHAGFDVTTITEHMSDAINDYVHQAMATGTEIPNAMKPLLQKMIDLGTLTDAAGDKITDLDNSGISFAETLTEGFNSIVDAIHELTRALGGVPDAINKIPRNVDVAVNYHENGRPGEEGSAAATGGLVGTRKVIPFPSYLAVGGFPGGPRGTDTVPVWTTPGEMILNASQQRNIAGALGSDAALVAEIRGLRQDLRATGTDGTTVIAQFGTQRFEALAAKATRRELATGRARPRASAGRSY